MVSNGDDVRDLGICVPSGTVFTLTARVPVRQMQGSKLRFSLVAGNSSKSVQTVPVINGEPFPHLDKLESARLQDTGGQTVIIIDQE